MTRDDVGARFRHNSPQIALRLSTGPAVRHADPMAGVSVQVRYDAGFGIVVVWCRACGIVAARAAVGLEPTMDAFLSRHAPEPCPSRRERHLVAVPSDSSA